VQTSFFLKNPLSESIFLLLPLCANWGKEEKRGRRGEERGKKRGEEREKEEKGKGGRRGRGEGRKGRGRGEKGEGKTLFFCFGKNWAYFL
jgi:hypothetical protein